MGIITSTPDDIGFLGCVLIRKFYKARQSASLVRKRAFAHAWRRGQSSAPLIVGNDHMSGRRPHVSFRILCADDNRVLPTVSVIAIPRRLELNREGIFPFASKVICSLGWTLPYSSLTS